MTRAKSTPLVVATSLSKVYVSEQLETHALAGVNVTVQRGEFVTITGPSGCGKSTLLSILGMMEVPSGGQLHIDGNSIIDQGVVNQSLAQLARLRNQLIGFVFQDFNLIGDLSVIDNVALPLNYAGMPRDERRQQAANALASVGMEARMSHMPAQLSGGQQQRAAIARAIVGEPPLLLADEPTGNLDSENSDAVIQLLRRIHERGTTVCLVTHDVNQADAGDRRIEMLDGKIANDSGSVVV